ncbi:MAG: hypothetical protein AABY22_06970 [Nanoarchaeota archaeon]
MSVSYDIKNIVELYHLILSYDGIIKDETRNFQERFGFAHMLLNGMIPRYRKEVPKEFQAELCLDLEGLEEKCQNILGLEMSEKLAIKH